MLLHKACDIIKKGNKKAFIFDKKIYFVSCNKFFVLVELSNLFRVRCINSLKKNIFSVDYKQTLLCHKLKYIYTNKDHWNHPSWYQSVIIIRKKNILREYDKKFHRAGIYRNTYLVQVYSYWIFNTFSTWVVLYHRQQAHGLFTFWYRSF